MITITAVTTAALQADSPKRRLYGLAVPWDSPAEVSTGQTVAFAKGSVNLAGMPVVLHHDAKRPIGRVVKADHREDGHYIEASVSQTRDGDEALTLAGDGVLTGWSVGLTSVEATENDDGSLYVSDSRPEHLGLVVSPAFDTARVDRVAASRKESEVSETVTTEATPVEVAATDTPVPEVITPTPRRTPAIAASAMPSPGEYLFAACKRREDPVRWERVQAAVLAAAPHTLWDDVKGGTYMPLLGPVVDSFAPAERPVSTAFGIRQAPAGVKSFLRPSITAKLDPAAAAAEKTDVTDGPLVVQQATITQVFLKRAANVSAEALAFTSIDVLNLLSQDLVRAYLHGFEAKTVADIAALATGTPVSIAADGSDALAKLTGAAAAIYKNTYSQPDLLIMSPDIWAKIASFEASDGRPLFPFLGPANTSGENTGGIASFSLNVLGLRPVVTWSLGATQAFLASSRFVEVYESSRVDLRVDEPTILGVAIGIGGAQACWLANQKAVTPVTVA